MFGILNLSFWGYFWALMIMTQITIAAVTIYLHRHQAHRALDLHPIVSHFFRLWLWLTTGMRTIDWVSIHRKHHIKCETPDDPHSPQVYGLKKLLTQGAELYRLEAKNQDTLKQYGQGTPNDWMEKNIYSHSTLGIKIMFLIDLLLFGLPGISIWGLQMMWIPFWAAGIVNGIGHFFGYRNSETPDASTNLIPFGIFIGGEELHNNHHAYANSAKLSLKWWEFDIGWLWICILRTLHLAKVRNVTPKLKVAHDKNSIDLDTVRALLNNRFQIMKDYTHTVLMPVLKQEYAQAAESNKALFEKTKQLFIRKNRPFEATEQEKLNALLEKHEKLNLAYEYRQKLQELWQKTYSSQKELLDAIQHWARQAEAAGLEALQQFTQHLRRYCNQSI